MFYFPAQNSNFRGLLFKFSTFENSYWHCIYKTINQGKITVFILWHNKTYRWKPVIPKYLPAWWRLKDPILECRIRVCPLLNHFLSLSLLGYMSDCFRCVFLRCCHCDPVPHASLSETCFSTTLTSSIVSSF